MKTKLLFCFLLFPFSFLLSPCIAQVPQGFNYQAIARDGSGTILANQVLPVKIDIQTSLTGGALIYEESLPSVTSNQFGLITLVVGTGTQTGGSAASFSAIDWKAQTLFLKTIIQYPGTTWTTMGTSQIWAVPYSLTAKEVTGPLTKLGITGTTTDMEEALFEVKNQAGNTVFAVYNEGIRAYVGNGSSKGKKGGFAVGGYDATKGTTIYDLFVLNTDSARLYFDSKPNLKGARGGFSVGGYDMTKGGTAIQNYLDVSNDSVRIYIDSNPLTKGKKGGFSVGGYDMTKGPVPVQSYLDVSKDSVRIYIDSNPLTKAKKGGFAVGGYDMTKGTNDNYLNVNTDASGIVNPVNRILWYPNKNAFLAGNIRIGTPDSVGVNSFATGYQSKSRGMYSQAMGFKAIANGDYSTAIGKNAVANNINSFAFGEGAAASNAESYAIGKGAIASGYRSFAFGSAGLDTLGNPTVVTQATGDYSFALGQGSVSQGVGSFSIGLGNYAIGKYSTALGTQAWATKEFSTALGAFAGAEGESSVAIGYGADALGRYSIALGQNATTKGISSTAIGSDTYASASYATAIGCLTNAMGSYSTAMGFSTGARGEKSTSMGSGTYASGSISTALGFNNTTPSYCETAIGLYSTNYTPGSQTDYNSTDRLFVIGNGTNEETRSDALIVLKNAYTAIGHSSPSQMLDVNGNARFRGVTSGTFGNNLNIMADGTLTTATSDISMKENINQISDALDRVMKLRGVFFNWKNDSAKTKQIGMIAQEVEPVVPEIVFTNPVDGLKGINYSQASALFVEAIKEQQKQIEGQHQLIEGQQQQIETQQKEIDELKSLINTLITNQTAQVNKQ